MVICPKCGAQNGKRNPNPVKCCRCWYQFVRSGQVSGRGVEARDEALDGEGVSVRNLKDGGITQRGKAQTAVEISQSEKDSKAVQIRPIPPNSVSSPAAPKTTTCPSCGAMNGNHFKGCKVKG